MTDTVTGLFERGQTYNGPNKTLSSTYGQSVGIEGHTKEFTDIDPTSGSPGMKTLRSNRTQKCMIVRNVSGVTLQGKQTVKWAAGFIGRRVDGYGKDTDEAAAGVLDERLGSAGVRDEDLCWMHVDGPVLNKMPITQVEDISAGDYLTITTVAASTGTSAGRVTPLLSTDNVTQVKTQLLHTVGYAMSAVSSNQTTGNVLINLTLLKG